MLHDHISKLPMDHGITKQYLYHLGKHNQLDFKGYHIMNHLNYKVMISGRW